MTERGYGIRSGALKQGWETADFPIVCETCLGDNPYVRMLKHQMGKECKICNRPFTVFKWKAGTKGRFKKTEVCQTCARLKNVCQTCLYDLKYGLPVEIRDKFLGNEKVHIPECQGNRNYWAQLATQNLEQLALPYNTEKADNEILEKIAKKDLNYDRNLPHVCSFWLKGECNRGPQCSFRHENPKGEHSEGGNQGHHQNIRDRYYGVNDPVARKILSQVENSQYLKAPDDSDIKTLCCTYVDNDILEKVKDTFLEYGDVDDFTLINNHLYITYSERRIAEKTIKTIYSTLVIGGRKLTVVWTKKTTEDATHPAILQLPEYSLVPAFTPKLETVSVPKPPTQPPVALQTKKQQTQHLLNMMTKGESSDYSATRKDTEGGMKKNAVFNLVDY